MKRILQHVMETISEKLLFSLIPDEWISRKIDKDYGVDYEIEIVDQEIVSGKRIWIQLKSEESSTYKNYLNIFTNVQEECLSYQFKTKYLLYALSCPFPLLIFVADMDKRNILWLPIQDEINYSINRRNPDWKEQDSIQLRIPVRNNLKDEAKKEYSGLRWYALELSRKYNIMQLILRLNENKTNLQNIYEYDNNYIEPFEENILKQYIMSAKQIISEALSMELLYGKKGIQMFKNMENQHKKALEAIEKIDNCIKNKIFTFNELSLLISDVSKSINIISNHVSMYDLNRRYICVSD
jgi:hypothetical protein